MKRNDDLSPPHTTKFSVEKVRSWRIFTAEFPSVRAIFGRNFAVRDRTANIQHEKIEKASKSLAKLWNDERNYGHEVIKMCTSEIIPRDSLEKETTALLNE